MYTGGWFNHKRGSLYQYDDATDRNYSAYSFTSSYSGPGTWRYFKSSGIAVTGWKKISGKWYYFRNSDGLMVRDRSDTGYEPGVVNDNGNFYYFAKNGKMMSSKWVETGSGWTYLTKSGAAIVTKGWHKINKKWYFFRPANQYTPSNCLLGMLLDYDGGMYYLDDNGSMHTGWLKNKKDYIYKYYASTDSVGKSYYNSSKKSYGTWFYFASSGKAVSGWKKDGGKWYYFYSSGYEMAYNTSIYDNGKQYNFDSTGACTNP